MKIITFISDLHGHLPIIEKCDILIIAGDICPVYDHKILFQRQWLDTNFRHWLNKVPAKYVVVTAGNHDIIFEKAPQLIPNLNWNLLQNNLIEIEGISIWGSPYSLAFGQNWVFNSSEEELDEMYSKIPTGCDIIVTHGPPFMFGDYVAFSNENVGSKSLVKYIKRVKPKYVVSGHIHGGYGERKLLYKPDENTPPTIIVNASIVNERYQMVNPPLRYSIGEGYHTFYV